MQARQAIDGSTPMWWLAHGEPDVPDGLAWLSPAEQVQLAAIRFTKRHAEYLTRRWTAKRTLALALGFDATATALAAIEIGHQIGGAPYIRIDGQQRDDLAISLSDRAGWAVCLTDGGAGLGGLALGVDLECVEPRSKAFVIDFFTAAERDRTLALPPGDARDEAANLIWSAKEAVLKVLKVGLRADTRDVEIRYESARRSDGWRALEARVRGNATLPGWWRRDGVFVLTLAATHPFEPPALLPGGGDLGSAVPTESWLGRPLVSR